MVKVRERLSYVHGMADGLGVSHESNEGRVLMGMMGVVKDLLTKVDAIDKHTKAQAVFLESMDEDLVDLEQYVEAVDEDLDDIEELIFVEDTADMIDNDSFDDVVIVDGTYDELGGDLSTGHVEIECPNCQEWFSMEDNFEDDVTYVIE